MNAKKKSQTDTADREIVSTRVLKVPRELVFKAWTDPKHLVLWWGPNGFTNTFQEFDPKPGGVWRFVMRGPDGAEYPNKCVFVEVAKPERVVFDHLEPMHIFRVTATFDEHEGKTKVVFRMRFESAEECARVKGFIVEKNEENFDRLETQLSRMA